MNLPTSVVFVCLVIFFSFGTIECVELISYSSNVPLSSKVVPSSKQAQDRGYEYISSISLFPIDAYNNITYNATITLPPQSPDKFSDTEQQLWFYSVLGPSNNSLVSHIGIQAKVEFGTYEGLEGPQWIIRCLFITESSLLETDPIPITTPSAYTYSTGEYDPKTSLLTLYTQIIAAEDENKIASLLAIINYDEPSVPFCFQPSVVMEAQSVLENGCESFPSAGVALFSDVTLMLNDEIYTTTWKEQDGVDDYSPHFPCNITVSQTSTDGFIFLWS